MQLLQKFYTSRAFWIRSLNHLRRSQRDCCVSNWGKATVIANLAAAKDERNGSSETEGPVPKKKKQSKFMSLLEDVWEPEVRANPEERAKREVKKYNY